MGEATRDYHVRRLRGQGGTGNIPGGWAALFAGACLASLSASCEPSEERPAAQTAFPADLPKIDVHTHVHPRATDLALELFEANGIAIGLNLSGGMPGMGLEQTLAAAGTTRGALRVLCNLDWSRVEEPGFADWAIDMLNRSKAQGAIGLKVPKGLGLGVRLADGTLLAVDDARLDPVFERAGALRLPVLIHTGDPRAFFEPPTPQNERYEELSLHPEWSFADPSYPRFHEILAAFERRVARHPRTTFIGAHFGNDAEEPDFVARMLDRYPNYYIDTAARVPELGRHPAKKMKRFFTRYADRILFGTDLGVGPGGLMLGSPGRTPPTRSDVDHFFTAHFRYFETAQRGLAHPTPIQGRWTVDGIALPRPVLEKVYFRNAMRVFGLPKPGAPAPR